MKQPHNMKPGETKDFDTLGDLHEFAETYEHDAKEFKFIYEKDGPLVMVKI